MLPSGSDPTPFVLGITPRNDESVLGFLIRLAQRVGTRSGRLATMAKLRVPGFSTSKVNLEGLAHLSGLAISDIEPLTYRPMARFRRHSFRGSSIHRDILDLSRRRWCPVCLQEEAYHRTAWDLALLTVCPIHGCRLINRCASCFEKLDWHGTSLVMCRCSADLREAPVTAGSKAEVGANRKLLSLASAGDIDWLPDDLKGCDRGDLVWTAMGLGMFLTAWSLDRRVETLLAGGPDVSARVVVQGIECLECWPDPLACFLVKEQHSASSRPGRFGAQKNYGSFYIWLRGIEPGAIRDALIAVARQSFNSDPELVQRMHRSDLLMGEPLPRPPIEKEVISLKQARKILGRSHGSITRLLPQLGPTSNASEGRGVPISLSRAAVEDVASKEAGLLTLKEAAKRLAVSKARTREVLSSSLIDVRRRPSRGANTRWAVEARSLNTYLSKLEGRGVEGIPDRRTVTFNHAVEALRQRGVGIAAILAMVADGNLSVAFIDESLQGLKRLRFDKVRLRGICRTLEGGQLLSFQAASEKLGLKWEVVAHLARVGLIENYKGEIPSAEVQRFTQVMVSGSELAAAKGTSPRALAWKLASRGVFPVSGRQVDGGRQNFFRRSDVASLL